jgi:hypothetical protein
VRRTLAGLADNHGRHVRRAIVRLNEGPRGRSEGAGHVTDRLDGIAALILLGFAGVTALLAAVVYLEQWMVGQGPTDASAREAGATRRPPSAGRHARHRGSRRDPVPVPAPAPAGGDPDGDPDGGEHDVLLDLDVGADPEMVRTPADG